MALDFLTGPVPGGGAAKGSSWTSKLAGMFSGGGNKEGGGGWASAIPQIGASALSGYMGQKASNDDRAYMQGKDANSLAEERRQFDLGRSDQNRSFAEDTRRYNIGNAQTTADRKQGQWNADRDFGQSQALTGLEATQMNPYTQQKYLGQTALSGVLMNNFKPVSYNSEAGKWEGGLDLPAIMSGLKDYYSPTALAAAGQTFTRNAQAASPTYQGSNLEQSGFSPEVAAAARAAMPTNAVSGLPQAQQQTAPDFSPDLSAFQAPPPEAASSDLATPTSVLPPALMDQIRGFQVGSGPGALSGAMKGAGMGSMIGPWGTAIGGGIGALAGALSGGEGKNTNNARDEFKSLFGDAQGKGMEQQLDPLYDKIPGLYDAHLQFNQAGKQKDLQGAISRLSALLSGGL